MGPPGRLSSSSRARRFGAAGLLWLALGSAPAWAVVPAQSPSGVQNPALAQPSGATVAPASPKGVAQGKSGWTALSPLQQRSLAPLAGIWSNLGAARQRKWLALSENFSSLSPPEQQTLHSRMRDWAALSTRQQAQARLNFGETKQLSAAEKKALWDAYQALPPEAKKKLAAGAKVRPPTTAAAVKPARQKLARLPRAARDARPPRIAAGPATEIAPLEAAPGRTPGQPSQQAH